MKKTPGSTGLDLSPTSQYVITPDLSVQIIPTGVYGPLPQGTVGSILGKSRATIKGLQIYPDVINEDHTGEIKILTQAPAVFFTISPEIKIAQLVILPNVKKGKVLTHIPWINGRFGSSNHTYWVQQVTKDRPEMTFFLDEKWFGGLLNTDADVSVIAARHWPKRWACQPSAAGLQGVKATHGPLQGAQQIHWRDDEEHSGLFAPYVLDSLPVNLWGRDVLDGMGVILCSPNSVVSQQMFQQGYNPLRGLGKYQQGRLHPVQPLEKLGRTGLGYQTAQPLQ
jgi:dUTPase